MDLSGSNTNQNPEDPTQPTTAVAHSDDSSPTTFQACSLNQEPVVPLSRNKLRKQKVYEQKLLNRVEKRSRERQKRKLERRQNPRSSQNSEVSQKSDLDLTSEISQSNSNNPASNSTNQRNLKKAKLITLSDLKLPKIVIDCQYDQQMSLKEQKGLAQQLRRIYSSNRKSINPLQLYFTNISPNSSFFNICCQQNDGFAKYSSTFYVNIVPESITELFPNIEQLVYLSPDSTNELETIDENKVYVIGGLVDETVTKNISYSFCQVKNIQSAKLPIGKYFCKGGTGGSLKQILTVNQVFDIILKYQETNNWIEAILAGLPPRTGLVPKDQGQAQQASSGSGNQNEIIEDPKEDCANSFTTTIQS